MVRYEKNRGRYRYSKQIKRDKTSKSYSKN